MLIPNECCPQHSQESFACTALERLHLQYRDRPVIRKYVDTVIAQVGEARQALADICAAFDLDAATGQTLTTIGENIGWERCHCNIREKPVFGFRCGDDPCSISTLGGFCDAPLICGPIPTEDYCFEDDDLYRAFIKAYALKKTKRGRIFEINQSLQTLFGTGAGVVDFREGKILAVTGIPLSAEERTLGRLYERVIPVALGMKLMLFETPQGDCPKIFFADNGQIIITGTGVTRIL